ncbi:hypothetical protein [uncultured Bradyrhizobium sp.]|uniref:hypothetical protein n=1 Tax=uncultured Bradyrhizobium sp. TaxID=199684 RepID=UPI0035CA3B7A
MIKETKYFRKQADKAERLASTIKDGEASQSLLNLASGYRAQAEMLKKKTKKRAKKPQ